MGAWPPYCGSKLDWNYLWHRILTLLSLALSDKNQLKVQGLAFGQAFQTVFKVSAMYSVDHPAAGRSMQQSWDLLVPLLKQGGQFTFGFMNQRVLLNSSLVSQTNLTHLEVEFTKREIAAITFQAGVTLKDFKRALALLTTRAMVIAERGGIKKFLAANPIEGVRITPAAKPKEEGDMIEVGMDMESFLTAQAILGPEGASGSAALDLLLDAAGAKETAGVWRLARANWWPWPTPPLATRWRIRMAISQSC